MTSFYDRKGKKHKPETIEKMKESSRHLSGKDNGMFGKKHKPETIKLYKENNTGINNPFFGHKHTEETLIKMRKPRSEETKAKLRKPKTQEQKDKIKESWHKYHNISGDNNPTKNPEVCKKISEAISGENNGSWNGGSSFLPYCHKWTPKFRESVRIRDNHTCQLCGKTQNKCKRKLDVHHVHYLKSDCYPDCITLCNICNIKANTNRNYWEQHYMNKLNDRQLLFWTRRNII